MASFLNGLMGALKGLGPKVDSPDQAGSGLMASIGAQTGTPRDAAAAPGSGGLVSAANVNATNDVSPPPKKPGFFKRISTADPETGVSFLDRVGHFGEVLQASQSDDPARSMAMVNSYWDRRVGDARDRQSSKGLLDAIESVYGSQGGNAAPAPPVRSMQGPGLDGAPVARGPQGPEAMSTGPASQQPTRADQMDKLRGAMLRAQARGVNTEPYQKLLDAYEARSARDAYLGTVPGQDRARATFDPESYMKHEDQLDEPSVFNAGDGHIVTYDRRSRTATPVYSAPQKTDPVTQDRVVGHILERAARGERLSAGEQAIYSRYLNGTDGPGGAGGAGRLPTTSNVIGAMLSKVQRGGVESLTPGEKAIWDRYNRDSNPFAGLLGDGADDVAPARAPGASAATGPAAPPAQPRQAAGAASAPPVSALKPGMNTTFKNGQTWTVRNGKPVRVR